MTTTVIKNGTIATADHAFKSDVAVVGTAGVVE